MKTEYHATPYISGTAEKFSPNRHRKIPIDVGDTCNVVGGTSYIDRGVIRTAWPILHNSNLAVLPFDVSFFQNSQINTEKISPGFKSLVFTQDSTSDLAHRLDLEISDNQIFRKDGIRYRSILKSDLQELKSIYDECFGYPIAPDIILALFTQTGGHLGGIFEGEKMIGFSTILVANLRNNPSVKAFFVDSVGTIPEKRNLHIGSFALQAVELAARDAGISHVALTHADQLTSFYKKNGFKQTDYLQDVYGPGASRIYAVKSFENNL